jgi:hypothetical protein
MIGTLALLSLIVLFTLVIIWSWDPWGLNWEHHRCHCHDEVQDDYIPAKEIW